MESNEPRSCPVCSNTFQSEFCEKCGAKFIGKRITSVVFLAEVLESFFGMHRSVFQNFKHLFLSPEKVVEAYWGGFRRAFYSPGRMMVIASLMLAICFYFNNNTFLGINVVVPENISTNIALILIVLPVLVLSTQLTYFRNRKNFFEHIVLNAYVFGFVISIFALFSLAEGLFVEGSYLQPLVILSYYVWVARVFEKKWYRVILMTIVNLIVFSAFIWVLILLTDMKK